MSRAKVRVPAETLRFLKILHPDIKKKLKAGIRQIAQDPMSGKALKDELDGLRSFRVGRYRIVYRLGGATIDILAVGPRDTIYEDAVRKFIKEKASGKPGKGSGFLPRISASLFAPAFSSTLLARPSKVEPKKAAPQIRQHLRAKDALR